MSAKAEVVNRAFQSVAYFLQ